MKKIFLLTSSLLFTFGAFAQGVVSHSVVFDNPQQVHSPLQSNVHAANPGLPAYRNSNPLERKTGAGGEKWFSYFYTVDANLGNPFTNPTAQNLSWGPMWWDSTVNRRYSNGLFANELAGVCQTFDPIRFSEYNNTLISTLVSPDQIEVTASDDYVVDTIRVYAAYVRNASRPAGIKDTLIISITPQENDYYYDSTGHSWMHNNPNVPTADTTLFSPQPYYADSIHRAALPDFTGAGAVQTLDTIILDPMVDGHLPDLTSHPGQEYDTLRMYQFIINGGAGAAIPAGKHFAVTMSFKSGDTYSAGDSVQMYSRFEPVFGYEGSASAATWMTYWHKQYPSFNDYNGASYIDSRGRFGSGIPDHWVSEFTVQDANNFATGWPSQYLFLDAHITCAGCRTIAQVQKVSTVNGMITGAEAYPNPASNQVLIRFALNQTSDAKIMLTNMVGQVVATQSFNNVKNGKALFNTSNFAQGVYFYTIEANGQRSTDRLVIVH